MAKNGKTGSGARASQQVDPQDASAGAPTSRLHIVVCIKPVPDPARWEKLNLDPETMLLNRSEVSAVINALDLNALEQALVIKEDIKSPGRKAVRETVRRLGNETARGGSGVTISVLTMAPPAAEEQLREALAMGCDRGYLLSDRAFAGADTLATARCLAAAIKKIDQIGGIDTTDKTGGVDLVFCGGYSADGSTAQVGPQIAELLAIPDLTHVVSLEMVGDTAAILRAACKVEEGTLLAECDLPALVTFDREANRPRLPDMPGIRRARDLPVVTWTAADLGLDREAVGLKGSPTQMLNVYTQSQGRKGEILSDGPGEMAGTLVAHLLADKTLDSD
jgi:electron transfer flavoprotein beta subunit